MTTAKKLLTAEEFAALPDDGRRLELINGEVVEMAPGNVEHGSVTASLTSHLFVHVMDNSLGRVVTADPGIFLQRNPDIVRAPDVCFYSRDREPSPEDRRQGWTHVIPDLVAEVVSPGDTATEIEEKVLLWLAAGVRLVVVLFPRLRSVAVYTGPNELRRYGAGDTLDLAPVLPEFRCPVERLFS